MYRDINEQIARVLRDPITFVPYNQDYPAIFETEADRLREMFPAPLMQRIEHFGSTSIPGISGKPIIDMLILLSDYDEASERIVPVLESEGMDYFWRETTGAPDYWYHWFIKRNESGERTHHLHMVTLDSPMWDTLYFRDYLREFPDERDRYETLKRDLWGKYEHDRVKYTEGKSNHVMSITTKAKAFYSDK